MSQTNEQESAALDAFTAYFVKNYPGDRGGTIICDPTWHAPKLFRAAMQAAKDAGLLPSAAYEPHSWMYRSEDPYDAGEWMWSDTKPDRREIFPLFTRPDSARPSAGVDSLTASEALYGFAAWLTGLDHPVTLGANYGAAVAAEMVGQYCLSANLAAPRDDFHTRLPTMPCANEASAPVAPAAEGDKARLDWLEANEFDLATRREDMGEGEDAIWWFVVDSRKSTARHLHTVSGHPLGCPREAIDAAMLAAAPEAT